MSDTTINDGGPAFPCESGVNSPLHPNPGMSLRDWFASQSGQEAMFLLNNLYGHDWARRNMEDSTMLLARVKLKIADAMLAERSKR